MRAQRVRKKQNKVGVTIKKRGEEKRREEKRAEEKKKVKDACGNAGKSALPPAAEDSRIHFDYAAGKFSNLRREDVAAWTDAYPAVDVQSALRRMAAWAAANPKNRKSDWKRYIVNWLARDQDRAKMPNEPMTLGRVSP